MIADFVNVIEGNGTIEGENINLGNFTGKQQSQIEPQKATEFFCCLVF